MNILNYLWDRRTTVFGYLVISLGVMIATDGLFSPLVAKWLILVNGILTACLGHYNNQKLKQNVAEPA